jgi:hypothetical protein
MVVPKAIADRWKFLRKSYLQSSKTSTDQQLPWGRPFSTRAIVPGKVSETQGALYMSIFIYKVPFLFLCLIRIS